MQKTFSRCPLFYSDYEQPVTNYTQLEAIMSERSFTSHAAAKAAQEAARALSEVVAGVAWMDASAKPAAIMKNWERRRVAALQAAALTGPIRTEAVHEGWESQRPAVQAAVEAAQAAVHGMWGAPTGAAAIAANAEFQRWAQQPGFDWAAEMRAMELRALEREAAEGWASKRWAAKRRDDERRAAEVRAQELIAMQARVAAECRNEAEVVLNEYRARLIAVEAPVVEKTPVVGKE